jgi:hypothetical protein
MPDTFTVNDDTFTVNDADLKITCATLIVEGYQFKVYPLPNNRHEIVIFGM